MFFKTIKNLSPWTENPVKKSMYNYSINSLLIPVS